MVMKFMENRNYQQETGETLTQRKASEQKEPDHDGGGIPAPPEEHIQRRISVGVTKNKKRSDAYTY